MTHHEDMAPYDPLEEIIPGPLTAIGWLEPGQEYPRGEVSEEFFLALMRALVNPLQRFIMMGIHHCGLCRFSNGPHLVEYQGLKVSVGSSNLFLPYGSKVFIAPSLIVHYIDAHEYCPPEEFQRAVLECPGTRSGPYFKELKARGLWKSRVPPGSSI